MKRLSVAAAAALFLSFSVSLSAVSSSAPASPSAGTSFAPFDTAVRRLMTPAGFQPADLNLLVNFRAEIPRTLKAAETLLRRPGSLDSLVPAMRASLDPAQFKPAALFSWIDVIPPPGASAGSLEELARSLEKQLRAYTAPLHAGETAYLLREVPPLFRPNEDDTSLTPVESERERLRSDAVVDSAMKLAQSLPQASLAGAVRDLEAMVSQLRAGLSDSSRPKRISETLAKLNALRKRGIPVSIGSPGNDTHRLDKGIVFDPGGDDRYVYPAAARPGTWLLVIDLDGNDTYLATDSVGAGAGFLSVQAVEDWAGDDRYLGADFAFGSAVMGYSRLYDAAGDDLYQARCASLGFAFRGIGILQDGSGHDLYSAAYLSEGASSSGGFGLLMDETGNDQYLARPVFPDDLRYRDHFLSLSQGFSTGFSPRYSGGLGVLWDRAGEDTYSIDIFGQGTGYWFGWGLLMDDAGNDKFMAYQYAQGAGVHFAVGTLWDKAGDDLRASKGVSQGCGHDGGFGLLVDEQGNDRALAADMSTGAGSANGLGVYLDLGGADIYTMTNPVMTLGHGDMRRDRGSLGFFLDLGGADVYPVSSPGRARDNAAWREYDSKSRGYGYGLDAP